MLIEIIVALLLGCTIGTFTGLVPGIHINTVSVLLLAISVSILSKINSIYLIVFISAMSITHTFVDFIPSVFLGCPDTDTELSVLPGHDLLKKGLGYEAVILTCYGSIFAIFILILIAFPSIKLIPKIYELTKSIIPFILMIISSLLILTERKKFSAIIAFFLSGFLGYIALNLPSLNQPLVPLLTGLFGSSMLILTIKNKSTIPKQKITKPKTKLFSPLISSLISSPLCSFLPGLGSGQAVIISNTILKTDKKSFLVLIGATNTLVMGFSFISLYAISKTRTGAASAIQELIGNLPTNIFILILFVILFSGIISFFLTKKLAKIFSQKITKINYTKISLGTLIILILVVFLSSGFLGILILILSTLTGIYCIKLNIRRTNMMGCLLIPTILLYLL